MCGEGESDRTREKGEREREGESRHHGPLQLQAEFTQVGVTSCLSFNHVGVECVIAEEHTEFTPSALHL